MYFIVGKTINQNRQVISYLITDGNSVREVTPQQVYLEYQRGTLPYINGFNVTTGELDFKNIDNSLLPTFYNNRGLSNTVSVLKILTDNDSQIGVRVLVASGKIMNVRLSDIIQLVNSEKIKLFNAKIVNNKVVMKYAGSIVTESNRGNKEEVTINNYDKSKFIIVETSNPKDNLLLKKYKGSDKEVIIPKGVTGIGESAFADCKSLTSVTIPSSVMYIGNDAFRNCTELASVTIRNGVTGIGKHAFQSCIKLTSITIPNTITIIGESAFANCESLTSIAIPNSVTSIGNYVFSACTGLTSIKIPSSVKDIGESAFLGCFRLTSIGIPDSVTSIGMYAFNRCKGLTSIIIPNTVTSIGIGAFYDCTGLTSITIPNSVISIGEDAFYHCKGLTSVIIPDSVTSIGETVFCRCTGLKSITIPDSVTSIDKDAFYGCPDICIKGVHGSAAEEYAMDNNIKFEAIK